MVYDITKIENWNIDEENLNNIHEWAITIANEINNKTPRANLSFYQYELYDFLEGYNFKLRHEKELKEEFNKGIYSSWLIVDYVLGALGFNPILNKEESDKNIKALINFLIKEQELLNKSGLYKDYATICIYMSDKIRQLVFNSFFKVDMFNKGTIYNKEYEFLIEYGSVILTLEYSIHYLKRDL